MVSSRHFYPQELAKIAQARAQTQLGSVLPHGTEAYPKVTVVLLSLNRLHLTRRCIDSLYANSDYPFELLIHDDGSRPEIIDYLHSVQSSHDNVRLVEQPSPIGWGPARNLAFELATTEYIFSMDNDMICHPGWLRETMYCAIRHRANFVAPLRLNPDGSVWAHVAELIRTERNGVLEIARWFHDLPLAAVQSLFEDFDLETNFVPGGAGLFRRSTFFECGGFDERFRTGFEDLDFCLKLAARGFTVWATARAILTHDDEWLPQSEADVVYARKRYDPDGLRAAADVFEDIWGIEVLPEKYVTSFQRRLDGKLIDR